MSTATDGDALAEYVEHFRYRVFTDAVVEATRICWVRRAEAFEQARHRPGVDWPGRATVAELREQWRRCDEAARACRARAAVALLREPW